MAENTTTQERDELTEALNDLFTDVSTMIKGDLQVSFYILRFEPLAYDQLEGVQ